MRITNEDLTRIIKEELESVISEKKKQQKGKKRAKKVAKRKKTKKDACYSKVKSRYTDMSEKGYTHIDPKKVEKILRDEGGAAGLDPFLKEFGEDKKEDILKILEDMPTVKKHENGDYILDDDKDVDLSEKKLTKKDKQQKEKFVKGMKKNKKGFEKSYGKDAESVMYATATKMGLKKP